VRAFSQEDRIEALVDAPAGVRSHDQITAKPGIDRWYDPECTDYMIDTFLCHTFCNFDGSMIAPK
jgi:hypothetical protein